MTEPESGLRLGPYELLCELGQGGMASVWVARQHAATLDEERLVAVKVMLPELVADQTFRSMFLREGAIAASIHHPHVVEVYEVAETSGLLFMAMEWVEGDSLRTLIREARQRRAIPPEMAVRIIADAAAGLHAAHEVCSEDGMLRGVVHCDVSPHNILIGPKGQAKLVDFGVARAVLDRERTTGPALQARQCRGSTAEVEWGCSDAGQAVQGKYGYMSPEQGAGAPLDRRSDVFSLGVVLFELTTGKRLFQGVNPAETLGLVLSAAIPRPSSLVPDYPEGLERIVLRALERDASARFQTAAEMREALERHLLESCIVVSHAGVGQLVERVIGTRIERRRRSIRSALERLGAKPVVLRVYSPASGELGTSSQESITGPTPSTPTDTALATDLGRSEPLISPALVQRSRVWQVAGAVLLGGAALTAFYTRREPSSQADRTARNASAQSAAQNVIPVLPDTAQPVRKLLGSSPGTSTGAGSGQPSRMGAPKVQTRAPTGTPRAQPSAGKGRSPAQKGPTRKGSSAKRASASGQPGAVRPKSASRPKSVPAPRQAPTRAKAPGSIRR